MFLLLVKRNHNYNILTSCIHEELVLVVVVITVEVVHELTVTVLDIPDRELNCVGYWLEDMKSYMITFDLEDAVSNFRCWVCFVVWFAILLNFTCDYLYCR